MALLLIEGFEGFGDTLSAVPSPAGIIARKYPSVAAESATRIVAGRTGGRALRFENRNCTIKTAQFATTDDTMIVGLGFYAVALSVPNEYLLGMVDDVTLGMNLVINQNGTIGIRRGVTLIENTTNALLGATWYYIEFKVKCHDTTGEYELRVNDTVWASDTSVDTKAGSNNYHDVVEIGGPFSFVQNYVDDWYVADGSGSFNNNFLGNVKVVALYPNASGDDTDWTPSAGANYAAVDEEEVDDDATYVETSGSGNQDLYNFDSLPSIGNIKGVQINTEVRVTDAQSWDLNAVIESGTTTSDGDPETIASTGFSTHKRLQETDPDTTALWTQSGINACQFGVKATTP